VRESSTRAPSVTVVLSLEAAPRLISDALTDAEANRLADWILSQRDLTELVDLALLSRTERLRSQEAA